MRAEPFNRTLSDDVKVFIGFYKFTYSMPDMNYVNKISNTHHCKQNTVGAKSLERGEKFRAQIQSLLLSSTIKLESCTLEKVYRDTC